jgi:hypothetical protein
VYDAAQKNDLIIAVSLLMLNGEKAHCETMKWRKSAENDFLKFHIDNFNRFSSHFSPFCSFKCPQGF